MRNEQDNYYHFADDVNLCSVSNDDGENDT